MEQINREDISKFIGTRLLKKFNNEYFDDLKTKFTIQTGKKEKTRRITLEGFRKLKENLETFIKEEGLNPNLNLSVLGDLILPFKEELGAITQLNFLDGFKESLKVAQQQSEITKFLKSDSYKPTKTIAQGKTNLRLTKGTTPKLQTEDILSDKGLNINKSLLEQDEGVITDSFNGLINEEILQDIAGGQPTEGKSEATSEGKSEETTESEEKEDVKEETEKERIEREASEVMGKMKMTGELDEEVTKRLESGQSMTEEEKKAYDLLQRQKKIFETKKGEGAGINPSSTTEQIAEELASNQEGGEASINEPELQTPQEPQVEAEPQTQTQPPNVTTEVIKQDQPPEGDENRINIGKQVDDIPKETILSKIDESRFSTQFKTLAQLNEDIKYFISNFGNVLGKSLIEEYNKINKQNLAQVRRLHGKMSGVLQTDKKKEVKIGIIIDADEYIREKINMVIAQNATKGLKASGLIINVEGETTKEGDKSIGNFDVRKARLGGSLAYQREPVYRFIPKSDPQNVDIEERKKPTGRGIQMLGTKRIDLVSTARRQRANDPFAKSRNPIKLKYIY